MRRMLRMTTMVLFAVVTCSQVQAKTKTEKISLWGNNVPGLINTTISETTIPKPDSLLRISNITHPTLEIFFPKKPNGTAVIICPGGGYGLVSYQSEGTMIAQWLNSLGITCGVLKYRMPGIGAFENNATAPLMDAQRAIQIVRTNAKKWHVNPEKTGIMGFSAGGHLAASASTLYKNFTLPQATPESVRPSFSILIYPVISMEDDITHKGSQKNLLSAGATDEIKKAFSCDEQADKNTPPAFLLHAANDQAVPFENSIRYFKALTSKGVKAQLNLIPEGGHGFGGSTPEIVKIWYPLLELWLQQQQLISSK